MKIVSLFRKACFYTGSAAIGVCNLAVPANADISSKVSGEFQIEFAPLISPLVVSTLAETFAEEIGGDITAISDADANFSNLPDDGAFANGFILSQVEGGKKSFIGNTSSLASASGLFLVAPEQKFSFDFAFKLELQNSIDDPVKEIAKAFGGFGLFLSSKSASPDDLNFTGLSPEEVEGKLTSIFNENFNFLEEFQLLAELNTKADEPLPQIFGVEGFKLSSINTVSKVGGIDEELFFDVQGSYSRKFDQPTFVKLDSAIIVGDVHAQAVPTPSLLWGIIVFGGASVFPKLKRS